jgi:hypothetical protein
MNIIYTVCNRTNLAHALALADSVLQYQPDPVFYLGWVDSTLPDNLPTHIRLLPVAELAIPQWEAMQQQYFDFELLPACRPWFALAILNRHADCQQLAFLAPTVLLKHSIEGILENGQDMLLTPNISAPLQPSRVLDDKRILNAGMFHSGSWILKPNGTTSAMLRWWASRTADRANFDLCNGMNADQLWLNYVPVWVPKTSILHHAGWHYGLNAVLNRKLAGQSGNYHVDGKPLISVDFAGLDFFDPIWSDHAALLHRNPTFKALFHEYKSVIRQKKAQFGIGGQPGFGKPVTISTNRILRNKMASGLKSLTTFIDQF